MTRNERNVFLIRGWGKYERVCKGAGRHFPAALEKRNIRAAKWDTSFLPKIFDAYLSFWEMRGEHFKWAEWGE